MQIRVVVEYDNEAMDNNNEAIELYKKVV